MKESTSLYTSVLLTLHHKNHYISQPFHFQVPWELNLKIIRNVEIQCLLLWHYYYPWYTQDFLNKFLHSFQIFLNSTNATIIFCTVASLTSWNDTFFLCYWQLDVSSKDFFRCFKTQSQGYVVTIKLETVNLLRCFFPATR